MSVWIVFGFSINALVIIVTILVLHGQNLWTKEAWAVIPWLSPCFYGVVHHGHDHWCIIMIFIIITYKWHIPTMVGFCHGGNLPESHRHHHHHHHHNHHQQCWFNIIMARRKRCIEAIMGGPLYKPSHVSWSHHHVLIASSAPWEAHHHHHPFPSSSCIEGYIGQAPLINPLALSWSHHHVLIASSAQTSSSDSCSQPRIDRGIAFPTGDRWSDSDEEPYS